MAQVPVPNGCVRLIAAVLYLQYAVSRLQASIFDSGSPWQDVFDENGTRTVY